MLFLQPQPFDIRNRVLNDNREIREEFEAAYSLPTVYGRQSAMRGTVRDAIEQALAEWSDDARLPGKLDAATMLRLENELIHRLSSEIEDAAVQVMTAAEIAFDTHCQRNDYNRKVEA
jgi:hypothetical protein